MTRFKPALLVTCLALELSVGTAIGGPCSTDIAAFEKSLHAGGPTDVTGPQTSAAQLHRQPTPSSVMKAQDEAQMTIAAALARAKALDDQNNPECAKALDDAKMMTANQ
jgi:hypothetical protein